jgi:hypothetical protein
MKINAKTFAGVGLGLVAGYFLFKSIFGNLINYSYITNIKVMTNVLHSRKGRATS